MFWVGGCFFFLPENEGPGQCKKLGGGWWMAIWRKKKLFTSFKMKLWNACSGGMLLALFPSLK